MADRYDSFLRGIRVDLSGPLPGKQAQHLFAPMPRPNTDFQREPGLETRKGAVLLLLYPHEGQVWLPLILRPTYSGVHSGQVGLPGGGHEDDDVDLAETALRETYEEIGVHQSQIVLLGALSPLYVFASDYLVEPYVGWCDYRPEFHPDPYEVARLITAPLKTFLDPANREEETWTLRQRDVVVPFFNIEKQIIWGATAMILSEFLSISTVAQMANIP